MHDLNCFKRAGNVVGERNTAYKLGLCYEEYLGDTQRAYRYYKRAASLLERIRGNLRTEPHKVAFLETKTDVFERMVPLAIRLGDEKGRRVYYRESFYWAEASKARSLVDLLAQGKARYPTPAVSETTQSRLRAATERDLRRLVAGARAHEMEGYDTGVGEDLSTKARAISYRRVLRKVDRIEEQLESKYPEVLSQYAVRVPHLKEITAHLEPDTLALEYFLGRRDLTVFPLNRRGLGRVVRVANVRQDLENAIRLIPDYLEGTNEDLSFLLDSKDHLYTLLVRLYEMLIEPLYSAECCLDTARKPKRLVIFPHGVLSYVPFHLLTRPDLRFLIDDFEVSYAPSAAAYMLCSAKEKRRKRNCIVFGTPEARSPEVRRLRDIEKEMLAIRQAFTSRCEVFYKERCNTENFKRFAGKGDILHFCGHGVLSQDCLDSSGLQFWDGMFTATEAFGLNLGRTSTAFLNACVMMKDIVATGSEVQGMVKGLFGAGAAALIIALWEIPDNVAELFARSFYKNYVGLDLSRAASVRNAMLEVRNHADPDTGVHGFEHPHFWGSYFLTGDWR